MSSEHLLTCEPLVGERVPVSTPQEMDFDVQPAELEPAHAALLTKMPWFTNVLAPSCTDSDVLPQGLKSMEESLLNTYRDACSKQTFRDVVGNRITLSPNQKSADPFVAVVFAFSFSRIWSNWVEKGPEWGKGGAAFEFWGTYLHSEGCTLAGPGLGQGWARVIEEIYVAFSTSEAVRNPVHSFGDSDRPSSRQLVLAALHRLDGLTQGNGTLAVVKALCNLEATAFFMNYMLRGHHDFPPQWRILVSELKSAAAREGFACNVAANLPPMTRLRQPLFMALAISPLVLLADISATSANLTRLHMLRAWYHYGSQRPQTLQKVEVALWKRLFAMARGEMTASEALGSFLSESLPLLPLAAREQRFFDPALGCVACMPVGLSYEVAGVPKEFIDATLAAHLRRSSSRSSCLGDATNPSDSVSEGELTNIASASSSDNRGRDGPRAISDEAAIDSPLTPVSTSGSESFPSARVGGQPVSPLSSCSAAPSSPLETNGWLLPLATALTSRALAGREKQVKRSKRLQPVLRQVSLFPAVQAYSRRMRARGQAFLFALTSISGIPASNVSSLGLAQDLEQYARLNLLVDRSNLYQRESGHSELFVKMTSDGDVVDTGAVSVAVRGSAIRHLIWLDSTECARFDEHSGLGRMLSAGFICVRGPDRARRSFERDELSSVGPCFLPRTAVDLSISDLEENPSEKFVSASFADFSVQLDNALSGKTMIFLDVPCTDEPSGTESLYTSLFSEVYASELPGCRSNCGELDRKTFVSRVVASAHALLEYNSSPAGLNTELAVESGAVVVFLGARREDFSFLAEVESFKPRSAWCFALAPDAMGLLLLPGDKWFVFLSVLHSLPLSFEAEPPILSLPLRPRFFDPGVFTVALRWTTATGQYCTTSFARPLTWIVNYSFRLFGRADAKALHSMHLPELTSVDGLLQLFSLLALVELGPVLVHGRYVDDERWKEVDKLYGSHRGLRQEVISALDSLLVLTNTADGESLTIGMMWESFFVQQCVTVVAVSRTVDHPHASAIAIESALFHDLRRRNLPVARAVDRILQGGSHVMGKSGDYVLLYEDCMSLVWRFRSDLLASYSVSISQWGRSREATNVGVFECPRPVRKRTLVEEELVAISRGEKRVRR
ncbi:hypothetical protein VNI00_018292 [Paramarasmius palmivorus]|uniref:Uncharacterized protein n=1 Tax=Paramarasmius palmivorus TaxID=297713 RepID=A0AAW0AYR6_9AGAR